MKKIIILLVILLVGINAYGQVGIGTTTPTETLDVAGTLKIDSAFLPGNNSGTTNQILISKGPGVPPEWSVPFTNPGTFAGIGKALTNPILITGNGTTVINIIDPNIAIYSVTSRVWYNPTVSAGGVLSDIAQLNDQWVLSPTGWVVYVYNPTGTSFTTQILMGVMY